MPSGRLKPLDEIVAELDAAELAVERASDLKLPDISRSQTLPSSWVETTLGEICEVNPRKPGTEELPDDERVSFVPMAAVDAELGSIVAAEVRIAGEVRKRFRGFREGDVLMAKITPSMENGKAAVASGLVGGYGFGTTEFHVLRPFGDVLSEYVFFFIRRRSFREEAAAHMKGRAGQKRVPAGFFETHEIPLAPPTAQAEIATHLRELSKQRHEAAQSLATLLMLVKDFRAAALSIGCLGGFAEREAPSREELAPPWEGEELPAIPDDWEWTTVGEVTERLHYGTSARSDADARSGVPNVGMGNIQAGELDLDEVRYVALSDEELETFRLAPGDVLFNRTNSPELVGKAALVEDVGEAVFASYLIRIQLDRSRAEPSFIAHWINSPWGRAWARRVKRDAIGQSNINSRKLAAMPLPLPPFEEQRAITIRIAELFDRADEIEARREVWVARLDELWESVLEGAFAGAFNEGETARVGAGTALDQLERVRVEREEERTLRRKSSRSRPSRPATAPARDRFERALAALPTRGFSFDELRRQLDLPYDDAVALLFDWLEDPDSPMRQKFDVRRGEMRLRRSKR
jgi:type I restriction enzyme S subunit